MGELIVAFDINSLLKLLTHYTEGRGSGQVPLRCKPIRLLQSTMMDDWIAIDCESHEWTDGMDELHVRYDGSHTLTWDEKGKPMDWSQSPEAPRRQK